MVMVRLPTRERHTAVPEQVVPEQVASEQNDQCEDAQQDQRDDCGPHSGDLIGPIARRGARPRGNLGSRRFDRL